MRGRVQVLVAVLLAALAVGAAGAAAAGPTTEPEPARPLLQVDLNKASPEELAKVPGIGPVLAKRIVEFREKEGPYQRVEDVLKVRGIGEKSLERMRPHLTVGKPK